ncbi:ribonuclease H-like domain-containing protein [Tanacetum coccineum]
MSIRSGNQSGLKLCMGYIKLPEHVQVYVDDIIFGSTKKSWCDVFEALMKSRFEMSSMGELTFFLGLQVKQKPDDSNHSQQSVILKNTLTICNPQEHFLDSSFPPNLDLMAFHISFASDNPHRTLKNKGIIDSGCSRHMTGNKAYLADFQDFNGGPVAFGGSKGYITGKGKIKTGKLDFEDVSFVKELQPFNLFSVSQMCDKKNKVLFTDEETEFLAEKLQSTERWSPMMYASMKIDILVKHGESNVCKIDFEHATRQDESHVEKDSPRMSSRTIELHIMRIPGTSERWIHAVGTLEDHYGMCSPMICYDWHFARECRTKEDNRRRDGWNPGNKDGSRTGKKEESKAMVTVDGESVDWTTHSEEPIEMDINITGFLIFD